MTTILVCNPRYYEVVYSINPWMHPVERPADRDLAISQWHGLVALLKQVGANVVVMEGQPGLPDMVFTANAGLVFQNKKVVLANFKYPHAVSNENSTKNGSRRTAMRLSRHSRRSFTLKGLVMPYSGRRQMNSITATNFTLATGSGAITML